MSLTRGLVLDVANQLGGAMPGVVTLHDWSRENNDGAMTNVTWTQLGDGAWVMTFAAGTARVALGANAVLDNLPTFTYMGWCRLTLLAGSGKMLIAKETGLVPPNWLYVMSTGQLVLNRDFSVTEMEAISPAGSIALDTFYFVVGTMSTTFVPRLFIDGAEVTYGTQTTGVGVIVDDSASVFRLGNTQGLNRDLVGNEGRWRILNYALSPAQIRAIYHSERWLFGSAT